MKRNGILNAELAAALARLGHTDVIVVADCGLPRPPNIPVIDLAVVPGLPEIVPVLEALAAELMIEAQTVAAEADETNPEFVARVTSLFGQPARLPHRDFKKVCASAALIVRTGEATPFANVLLRCGVPF